MPTCVLVSRGTTVNKAKSLPSWSLERFLDKIHINKSIGSSDGEWYKVMEKWNERLESNFEGVMRLLF